MKAGTLLVALVVAGACIAGIVWLTGGGGAIDVSSSEPQADPNGLEIAETGPYPKVVVPEKAFDFGQMASKTDMSHKFIIKNEGEAPLSYKLKGTNCSCTVSDMDPDKVYTVPVGEQAEVTVKWTPPSPEPAFIKEAQIYTNDPENPIVTFTVSGEVGELVTIQPAEGWRLDDLERSRPETLTAEIRSPLLEKITIKSVETSAKNLEARAEPLSEAELAETQSKSGQRILVTFDPKDLKLGEISETVTVQTDIEGHSEISLPVKGYFMGSITGLPHLPDGKTADGRQWFRRVLRLDLGQFPAAEGRDGWYKLIVADMPEGETFQVSDIQSSNESVTATVEPLEAPTTSTRQFVVVTFQVKPGIRPGSYKNDDMVKVVLKTNHPYAPEIKFQVVFQAL